MTEGPYWVDEQLNRSDIRQDPSNGTTKPGTPLTLQINAYQSSTNGCSPLANATVDIWHCDAGGLYSDEAANNTVGQKYLRGLQMSDSNGAVTFTTIYPGWYGGRAVHLHVRARTYLGSTLTGQFVSQFFFDDAVTDAAFTVAPYNTRGARDTRNANDMVYTGAAHPDRSILTLTKTSTGYGASINLIATLDSGVTTGPGSPGTRYAAPHIAYGGGWYTALYLTNLNAALAQVQVSPYGEDGSPLTVPALTGRGPGQGPGGPGGSQLTLGGNSTTAIELLGSATLVKGWLDLTLPPGVVGFAVLRQSLAGQPDQEALVPLSPVASQMADLIFDDTAFTTAVAIANPGAAPITLSATAYKDDGSVLGRGGATLPPRAKMSMALRDFAGLTGVSGARGRVTFTSTGGTFALLGLRFGSVAFTTIPVNYR